MNYLPNGLWFPPRNKQDTEGTAMAEDSRFFVFEKVLPQTPLDKIYHLVTEFSEKENAIAFCRLNKFTWWVVVVFRSGQAVSVASGLGSTHTGKEEETIEIR